MNSKRPVAPEGFDENSRQIAVWTGEPSPSGRSTRVRLILGLVWCSIGSAFIPLAPVISNVLVAFGMSIVMGGRGRREQVLALLVSLVSGAASTAVLFGAMSVPSTVLSVLCTFALAREYTLDRLSTTGLLLVIAATSLAMIGVDVVSASSQGTSVTELITGVVNEAVEMSVDSLDLDETASLLESRDAMVAYWPTLYFLVGAGTALFSLLGARLAGRIVGSRASEGFLLRYDVPLWVAELFALGVAIELLGPLVPAWQRETAMVGANVVMITRIALMQQGLSVLTWRMRERHVAGPLRVLATLSALWLELSFALTSIVGLADVVFNFRHLRRNRPSVKIGPTGER
ncbi:MAG: DUF2232 domain-containing protein [Atopobiaceae bacterium]|nr:DUF2232 domain-containing protein [Atopobiaceae bacterium]